jgi:tetratricopeptide (TPR) repeat protein
VGQFRNALLARPTSGARWGEYGNVLLAHEFTAEAAICYRRAEELDSREVRWPYLRGLCLLRDQPQQALDAFRRAVQVSPSLIDARLHLAELLLADGQLTEADAQLSEAAHLQPDIPRLSLGLGRLAFLRGRLDEALRHGEWAARAAPNVREVHILLCQVHHSLGDADSAARALRVLQLIPERDPQHNWNEPFLNELAKYKRDTKWKLALAETFMSQGQFRDAIELLKRSDGYEAGDARVLAMIGEGQLHLGDLRSAAASLDAALLKDPGSSLVHFHLGNLAMRSAQWERAIEHYEEAVRLQHNLAPAYLNLALCQHQLGDQDGSIAALQRACDLIPHDVRVRQALADVLSQAGRQDESLHHLERAAALAPNDPLTKSLLERAQRGQR